jgi:hypothetical protein
LEKPKPVQIPFDPLRNTEGTLNFFVLAFAFVGYLLGNGNKSEENAELAGIDAGELRALAGKVGWGDRRKYVSWKFFNFLDDAPKSVARQLEKVSQLAARVVLDARYLRTILANFAWLTIPAALTLTYIGLDKVNNQALPFSYGLTLSIILIGLFDSLAGAVAGFLYLDFLLANGNLHTKNEILFSLGYVILFFAPALLASKIRPLHRKLKNGEDWWVRLTDYILAPLLTGFATSKLVMALNSLFGYELKITHFANRIGVYVAMAVVGRMLLEDIAWKLYPNRTSELHYELKSERLTQKLRVILFKIALLVYFAHPYIGWNKYLVLGVVIFLIPQIFSLNHGRLLKSEVVRMLLPTGSVRIVLLGLGGIYLGNLLSKNFHDQDLILHAFIFLALPSAFLSSLDHISAPKKIAQTKKIKSLYKYAYRLSSALVLVFVAILLTGHNPVNEIKNAFLHPTGTIHSLTYKWWPIVSRDIHPVVHWISHTYQSGYDGLLKILRSGK